MKKMFYIAMFTLLGALLQFIAHALIETWYIGLLLRDFPKYSFGYSWEWWVALHNILSAMFLIGGTWFGYSQGKFWWRKLYFENVSRKF